MPVTPKSSGKKRKAEKESVDVVPPSAKRKRVSFGPKLSPELFVKKLPPSTPVRRGALPPQVIESPKPAQSPLLKRRSVAAPKTSPIKEETTVTPKVTPAKKQSPAQKKAGRSRSVSPAKKNDSPAKGRKSMPAKAVASEQTTPKAKSPSPRRASKSADSLPQAETPARSRSTSPAKSSSKKASPRSRSTTPAKESPKSSRKSAAASAELLSADPSSERSPSPRKSTSPFKREQSPAQKTSPAKASSAKKASPKAKKAGRKSAGDANLKGIKRLMKTPKNKNNSNALDISLTSFADLVSSPALATPPSARSKTKSASPIAVAALVSATPEVIKMSAKKLKSAKKTPKTPRGGKNLKRKRSSTGFVAAKKMKLAPPEVISPPVAIKKAVALR